MSILEEPLTAVLAGKTAARLAEAFDMHTVGEFVAHLPRRYALRGELTAISHLERDDYVTLVAEVIDTRGRQIHRGRARHMLTVTISDGYGRVELVFFNQPWREAQLRPGMRGLFSGRVAVFGRKLQLTHPDYELFDDTAGGKDAPAQDAAAEWARTPIAIYPATAKVSSWAFAKLVAEVLPRLPILPDPVPDELRRTRGELDYDSAVRALHLPGPDTNLDAARRALKFTEAFVLQAALARRRALAKSVPAVPRAAGELLAQFDAALPFELTADQRAVGAQLHAELASTEPMQRLLQGEVGSGKTLVAVRAMLQVAESGGQSALLAPTEVLAAQHLRSITASLGPELAAAVRPTLLTGSLPRAQRQQALLRITTGDARIVVGTHALLGEHVEFADLGLVIIDEQHRFGVEQREQLRRRGERPPHLLVLTATPIPRTIAMTAFGDLDVSTLRTLPAGRAGVESFVVSLVAHPGWLGRVWERTAEELAAGRQAFVVCPAIAPGDADTAHEDAGGTDETAAPFATVTQTVAELRELPVLAGRRIEALHGRQTAEQKDAVMRAFAAGEIDVLVATTVVEVGVDVPNAAVMVVLDADRFGISQLHQLRGRIGRGQHPGVCLLVTGAALESLAYARVAAVASTRDGFELAQRDLELRREGDVLGSRQSGAQSGLKVLRVSEDGDLIAQARAAADALVAADMTFAEHPALAAAIRRLGGDTLAHLDMT